MAPDGEIDRVLALCSRIEQTVSRLRIVPCTNPPFSLDHLDLSRLLLLSMSEYVEGSTVLLESLLAIEHRDSHASQATEPKRYHYTRETLLRLRQCVPTALSSKVKDILAQVLERENDHWMFKEKKSWRELAKMPVEQPSSQ
jgi:hypothetical protein